MVRLEQTRRHHSGSHTVIPQQTPVIRITPLVESNTATGLVTPLTITPIVEEFLEYLVIDKLLGKVIIHHLYLGICNNI